MKDVSETVSESIKYLGQGFLLAYYLPALVFTLTHFYVLVPVSAGVLKLPQEATKKLTLPLLGEIDLSSLVDTLLWSLIISVILFVLNSVLIRAFEGKPFWLKNGLLSPWTKRNRKNCKKLYGELINLQRKHLTINVQMQQTASPDDLLNLAKELESLKSKINEEHKRIEELQPRQSLPHDIERVCPTSFGNTYAIAEEYSYERYGADAVLFWPRLRTLMHENKPSHSLRLTQQKTVLDLSINFSLLSGILAVETVLILVFSGYKSLLLLLAVISLMLFISFYNASVSAIQVMGELIKLSFDYYRGLVLEAFHLSTPSDLSEEQTIWVKLAAFIRRGDVFYFPEEYRKAGNISKGSDEEQKQS